MISKSAHNQQDNYSKNDHKADLLAMLSSGMKHGRKAEPADQLVALRKLVEAGEIQTLEPLLPLLLTLKGKPYTLADHFPFAPLFRTHMSQALVVKAGRQAGKSVSIAANGILVANCRPFFNTLYVAPLYEQIRRLSTTCVRPFIEQSPVRSLWSGTSTENSVLQRSFKNESRMYFSYAHLDADRIRGISAHRVVTDEVQDMDPDLLPIIMEVMSYAEYPIAWYTGTPKTLDNALEKKWSESSQAEWFMKCDHCNKMNIPALSYDLLEMIGPMRDDISRENPATVCARCKKPINPQFGRWVHRYPNRVKKFAGYHVPQIIMPIHYGYANKWATLLGKMNGAGNTTKAQFLNEVLGESYDLATKLVTETDLRNAALLPWRIDQLEECTRHEVLKSYMYRCLAVDWGGGGKDETSFTTLAVLGWRPDGKIDVLWGKRLLTPHDHIGEARECLHYFNLFRCTFLAHDYTGAGSLRETFINHAGLPISKIIPIAYVRTASRDIMSVHPATRQHPRDYHQLDKARSLQLTCNCLKLKIIRTFQFDYVDSDNVGLLYDFLALIENYVDGAHAGNIYSIIRNPMFKDDFAQAVNIGACALWHTTGAWPNLAQMANIQLSEEQLRVVKPSKDLTWKDERV